MSSARPRVFLSRLLLASLLTLAWTSVGWAKKARRPGKPRAVNALVMPLKVKGLQRKEAASMGKLVGGVLVEEMKDLGVFRLLVGHSVSKRLKQLKRKKVLGRDCLAKRQCVRAVGRAMRAKVLFQMHLARAKEGVTLTLRGFDVRSGKEVRKAVEHCSTKPGDLERAARWATRKVSSPMITTLLRGKGHLEVSCQQAGANLYLNGKSFGKRTNKSFKVSAGVFDIQVKKEGFKPFHDVVVVKPGRDVKVSATLEEITRPAAPVVAAAGTGPGSSAAAAGVKPPAAATAPKPAPKPKADLPAWAVFEKKPEPGQATAKPGTSPNTTPKTAAAGSPTATAPKTEPFLPGRQNPMDEPVEKIDEDRTAWYQTWWFWTIVGVAVAGGVGGGLYAAGVFEGGGSTATGAAVLSWQ